MSWRMYYELRQDMEIEGRWLLGMPWPDRWDRIERVVRLKTGTPQQVDGPVDIPLLRDGIRLEFSFTTMGLPVVSPRVASILRHVAPGDVEFLPAAIRSV